MQLFELQGARALDVRDGELDERDSDTVLPNYQTMHGAPPQPNTARLSERMSPHNAHSLGHVAAD